MESINIIGAGLAGLSAAIALAEKGIACNLISSGVSERAQSVLAEGGINAALDTMGENDSTDEHFADTIKGGVFLADPNAVDALTSNAPETVQWLFGLGVPFQMDDGRLILRNFGGQKKKRTAYAKSSTGKMIMSALIDEARKYEASGMIVRYSHHEAAELIFQKINGVRHCCGIKMTDTYSGKLYACYGQVILAVGGMNGIFPGQTTGTVQNTGDMTASVFACGVEIANPEFIQYHPTTVGIPGKRMLVSEAARGEGGRLFILRNGKPWYFMEELYPELGNLMPRDVVSREMSGVVSRDDCGDQVYLDMRDITKSTWDKKLSDLRSELIEWLSIDPAKEPVPVTPGIHFFMGGILVDESHRTNIPGLYAAGECACQYHGANRLGGNSMLAAIFGGRKAAESAMEFLSVGTTHDCLKISGCEINSDNTINDRHVSAETAQRLRDILLSALGIVRNGEQLAKAIQNIDNRLADEALTNAERNRILLGKAMLLAAYERRESRGAHYRSDYPERDDNNFRKTTVCVRQGDSIAVTFRDIPERRTAHASEDRCSQA